MDVLLLVVRNVNYEYVVMGEPFSMSYRFRRGGENVIVDLLKILYYQ